MVWLVVSQYRKIFKTGQKLVRTSYNQSSCHKIVYKYPPVYKLSNDPKIIIFGSEPTDLLWVTEIFVTYSKCHVCDINATLPYSLSFIIITVHIIKPIVNALAESSMGQAWAQLHAPPPPWPWPAAATWPLPSNKGCRLHHHLNMPH